MNPAREEDGEAVAWNLTASSLVLHWLYRLLDYVFRIPGAVLRFVVAPLVFLLPWEDTNEKNIRLCDATKWHQKSALAILSFAQQIGGVEGRFFFDRLLRWPSSIPLVAYRHDRTNLTVRVDYRPGEDGRRGVNFIWFNRLRADGIVKVIGHFKHKDRVRLQLVWLSGEDAGSVFWLEKYPKLGERNTLRPDALAFPPRWLLLIPALGGIALFRELLMGLFQ